MARSIIDKWTKTALMRRDKKLARHMPSTALAGKEALRRMLRRHGMVYVKPTRGSQGRGVMRLERLGGGRGYRYQLGERRRSFATYELAYASIRRAMAGKRHIVQKGIRLLRHRGRAFDIRLMLQRSPRGGFVSTGKLARVAHPRKIVTNGSQGGSIYGTDHVLRRHAGPRRRQALYRRMDDLAQRATRLLRRAAPQINELGMDYAVDGQLKPWILEVNTRPDASPFTLLADQRMIGRIVRYGRGYGRTYKLVCKKAKQGV
ncbi:YheC/YheD family protein [Paenibacillus sp. IB182496]|uniref:YheC/YheD family protein n=1 Tax=Paenibacillus sabuli TaxID=2772509 RepID=A0A927BP43_9BACL|nr:YheC/YheD family protein [Paenibacillus sabuli]MBD2843667.1 YheC/YheD family protein [Paenibacillus sabuli]